MSPCFVLSLLLALVVTLTTASIPLDDPATHGYFPGRSGDVIFRPKASHEKPAAYLTLRGAELAGSSLPETSVADLVAHLMGVAPLHQLASRESFPRVDLFGGKQLPRANLLFFVNSHRASGDVALSTEAYPADSIARLTSVLTGSNPSKHGIIQRTWYDRDQGAIVKAYSNPATGARAATLIDLVTAAFAGNALIVSSAASRMHATALAAKSAAIPDVSNNHALFWDRESQTFSNVYGPADDLAISLADVETYAASLGTYDAASRRILIDGAAFDLNDDADLGFFAELSFVHSLISRLKTDERLKALVADKASDFFSFSFGFWHLERKYGIDAAEVTAAHSILKNAIDSAVEQIQTIYDGRVLVEIVSISSPHRPAPENLKEVQAAAAAEHAFVNRKVYPQAYFEMQYIFDGDVQTEACTKLAASLPNLEVLCADSENYWNDWLHAGDEIVRYSLRQDNNTGPSSDDIATFQIALWTSVILILTAIAASIVMAAVHNPNDAVIYNSPALLAKPH